MEKPATILVIIGITGDLSKRKLVPALEKIAASSHAPENFRVVGVTRRDMQKTEVLEPVGGEAARLSDYFSMYQMNLADKDEYKKLQQHLSILENDLGSEAQKIFYLSIPPETALPVVEMLGEAGFGVEGAKLLLEKPFGINLESARELVERATKYFDESQIYRIDHYLAKEMAQNMVVFRRNNSLFRRTWNKDFIESIEIIASETIGIEGRAEFYEQTGALRDVVQSHLLQLAALTLMHMPSGKETIQEKRLQALKNIIAPSDIKQDVIRAQYSTYRAEVNNTRTEVETFVAVTLYSEDSRWEGVPVRLITGKALNTKTTEIRLTYKQDTAGEANTLCLRIQPDEAVELEVWAKRPGYGSELQLVPLNFEYKEHFTELPEAYERVLMDAIRSDRSLFATSEEVLETWRVLEPVQDAWAMDASDLKFYPSGSLPEEVIEG